MEEDLKKLIKRKLPRTYEPLWPFFEHDLSEQGSLILAGVALRASETGISAENVQAAFEESWSKHWSYQHPEIRAAVRGSEIESNLDELRQIFRRLKMPVPEYVNTAKIPRGAIIVTTLNSTYRLGTAGGTAGQKRSISRDKIPLRFSSGRLVHLELGDRMLFSYETGGKNYALNTSAVLFID